MLSEFFRYLCYEEYIPRNPMAYVRMIKKTNFDAAQNKAIIAQSDVITVFTDYELELLKKEVFARKKNGTLKHHQAAAFLLMLNTGLRTSEILGLLNSDIDLEKREMNIVCAVKEVKKRNSNKDVCGTELVVGGLKTAASKRTIPLNSAAIEMIRILRIERWFGEDSPLISNQRAHF